MTRRVPHFHTLALYFLATYLLVLVNAAGYLKHFPWVDAGTAFFAIGVLLVYGALYLLPAAVLALALDAGLTWRLLASRLGAWAERGWIVRAFAVAGASLVQLLIMVDKRMLDVCGFHFNGVVWNLLVTPGGVDSLGISPSAVGVSTLLILAVAGTQTLLMVAVLRAESLHDLSRRLFTPRLCGTAIALATLIGLGQTAAYGICAQRGYSPVLSAADAFPFYQLVTFEDLARTLGIESPADVIDTDLVSAADAPLQYPKRPISYRLDHKPYNIVWLVGESWRADQLAPDSMPATWQFAQRAVRFRNHYTSGNRTARALFGMFYGLYGTYWPAFREAETPPALMQTVQRQGYQLGLYNSSKFTYPEFNRTIFAGVPAEMLHDDQSGLSWERDRKNVDDLIRFIEERNRQRPFMAFLFFDSPHSRYYFPPDAAIRTPYLEDVNYVTMDLERDGDLLKNRYVNSCHYMDTQIGRVLSYLENNGLLDSTIVVIVGDHGEEFNEKGRWGHGSAFSQEQTVVPMLLSVPGEPPREVTRLTDHADIVATLMPLLGVTNPPEDYTQGSDMLAEAGEGWCIVSDAEAAAIVGDTHKVILADQRFPRVTTRDDAEVADAAAVLGIERDRLTAMLRRTQEFSRQPAGRTNAAEPR